MTLSLDRPVLEHGLGASFFRLTATPEPRCVEFACGSSEWFESAGRIPDVPVSGGGVRVEGRRCAAISASKDTPSRHAS